MPTLSVIMIVKNEATCLAECLQSVAAIADEIVIGDTGSDDDTVAIAQQFGARVIDVPWTDDFSAARNETIRAATGDWLLHLDADEALDDENASAIRQIVDNETEAEAVELTLLNYCNDIHAWRWTPVDPAHPMTRGFAGCLPVGLLRLFRRDRGFAYREAVHENITASVLARKGKIATSSIAIHHYGYECEPEQRSRKAQLYLKLARKKRAAHPDDLKCLHDLAEQAMACGETREAEEACRAALALAPGNVELSTVLSTILLERDEIEAARDVLLTLERDGQGPAHAQIVLGVIAAYRGDWTEAEERLGSVIAAQSVAPLATLCLARVRDYQGACDDAQELIRALTRKAPNLEEARKRLQAHELRSAGEDAFLDGNREEALKLLVQALALDAEDGLIHNDLGVLLHTMGERNRARDSFERALKLAPALKDARDNLAQL